MLTLIPFTIDELEQQLIQYRVVLINVIGNHNLMKLCEEGTEIWRKFFLIDELIN